MFGREKPVRVVALVAVLLQMFEHGISPHAHALSQHPSALEELRAWSHGLAIDLGYGSDFDAMEHAENRPAFRSVVAFLWSHRKQMAVVVDALHIKHGII